MRFGGVSYLNARPLLEGLEPLVVDDPSGLTRRFERGEVDVALLPVAAGEAAGLTRVGSLGIAAKGPVESVLLFLKRDAADLRTVELDPASRTSRLLTLVVLRRVYGVEPEIVAAGGDAELVIGDQALVRARGDEARLDLADEWTRWTHLPFVFAAWYGDPRAEADLEAAYGRGATRLAAYACEAASELGLPEEDLRRYLEQRIRFRLGEEEVAGLERFRTETL
jgi:chorismate dehydratase